jgi:hypothetical protein
VEGFVGVAVGCDILEGKVSLGFLSKVRARPSVSVQDQIGQLYFDLSKIVMKELVTSKTARRQSASIGFGFGKIFEQYGINDTDKQSAFIGNLMDFLFVEDSLKLSAAWTKISENDYLVSVTKMTEAQVKILVKTN